MNGEYHRGMAQIATRPLQRLPVERCRHGTLELAQRAGICSGESTRFACAGWTRGYLSTISIAGSKNSEDRKKVYFFQKILWAL